MDKSKYKLLTSGVVTFFFIAIFIGCAPEPTKYYFNPYVGKSGDAPEIVNCFNTIGHKRGTYPFILGGTCCCTPTEELMDMYHKDGFLIDYDLGKLIDEYEQRGITLKHKSDRPCNNQCKNGPHVVFGGHCMVPPTVGTQNYENVISGSKPEI